MGLGTDRNVFYDTICICTVQGLQKGWFSEPGVCYPAKNKRDLVARVILDK